MIYRLLRAIAGLSLRWYYRGIEVSGLDRIPRDGPVLLVVNHPNALVDALVVGWLVRRRIQLTAKSTLFTNPFGAWFFRSVGVIPLRRAQDDTGAGGLNRRRNVEVFDAIVEEFERGGAIVIFPEGTTHDSPSIGPLRTGAARIALEARDRGVSQLVLIPIGLTFDHKDALRSRVFMQVGDPLVIGQWKPATPGSTAKALTAELSSRLRRVTLNYDSLDEAERVTALAVTVTRLLTDDPARGLSHASSLADETAVARRIEELGAQLGRSHAGDPALRARGLALAASLSRFRLRLERARIRVEDVSITTGIGAGARFVVREAWILALAGPVALWGAINHVLPFRGARIIAMRSVESAADPAMRTIVSGVALVLVGYLAQGAAVWALLGPWWAIGYLMSLPISADIDFRLRDRLRRVTGRARTYLTFRRDPELQPALAAQLSQLRSEALAFESAARAEETDRPDPSATPRGGGPSVGP